MVPISLVLLLAFNHTLSDSCYCFFLICKVGEIHFFANMHAYFGVSGVKVSLGHQFIATIEGNWDNGQVKVLRYTKSTAFESSYLTIFRACTLGEDNHAYAIMKSGFRLLNRGESRACAPSFNENNVLKFEQMQ